MTPRNYQIQSVEDIKTAFKNGYRNIALNVCGGAGKSLIAKMILDMAVEKKSKIGFFSYRKILIDQIKSYHIPNCTIGTLQKYGKNETELFDLVIVDESWGEDSKLKNNIKSKFTITLSGSPFDVLGYALPNYDYIVNGIQFPELVELGYAKKLKILSTTKVDTSKLEMQGGDYSVKQAYELMSKSKVYNDVVGAYKEYASGRKVMLFCVNTKHCEMMKDEFLKDGISAETIHSKKNSGTILDDFDSGKIKVLISVSKLNVGYDNPSVNCIMLCRPTKSIPVMLQTIWRGTRINKDSINDDCLVLDLANVIQDTIHPMQKIDLSKQKKDNSKLCKCGLKMKLSDRKIEVLNEFEYIVRSDYKCQCGLSETVENLKLINIEQCEGCKERFVSSGGLVLTKYDNGLCFDLECKHCGFKKPFRELKYSNDELQEITLNEALSGDKWENVKTILRAECKKCGYKWQYSDRILEHLQMKAFTPIEAIDKIKMIMKNGQKISRLMYV